MSPTLCLLAALGSMGLYGLASVAQAAAARSQTGARVLLHPLYVVGLAADAAAWGLSLVALVALPLVVVQPVLAGSVAVAVLLAVPLLGARLRRADAVGIALTTTGLVLVAVAAGDEAGVRVPAWFPPGILLSLALVALVSWWSYSRGPAVVVATVAGAGFAGAALAARAVAGTADVTSRSGLLHLLGQPTAWAVGVFGALGTITYARALERGGLGLATATMWVVEAVLPAVVGVGVLGDAVRPGWAPAAGGGLVLAVAGCVTLALSPTQAALAEG